MKVMKVMKVRGQLSAEAPHLSPVPPLWTGAAVPGHWEIRLELGMTCVSSR